MKRLSAHYLLIACVFLLGYAVYVLVDQWADIEGVSEIAILFFCWILPCIAGIYVVIANKLLRRAPRAVTSD